MKEFTIVGAGLVGSLQSVFLAKKGFPVHLFERRPDMRTTDIYQGKSINLAMSNRGWRALEKVGVDSDIKKIAIPMYKRTMHDLEGNLTYQPYSINGEAIYSVSRGELNKTLLNIADNYETTKSYFNARCTNINLEKKVVEFHNELTNENLKHSFQYLIGTDGAFSAVRHRLMFNDKFDYSQDYIEHGYKEFHIEPNADGTHQLDAETLHIWPREDFMMIALPNIDGSFTCTLFFPFDGKVSFNSIKTDQDIIAFFQYYFKDIIPLIPDFVQQYHKNPTSSLVTVRCYPWHYQDHTVLMGDAAHAIVPFYGQGMNCGFEDCFVFDQMMDEYESKFDLLFEAFGKSRKPNADAVAELALRNFIEMRDLTADADFLLRKKIEGHFSKLHPDKWTPLYSMVTFSNTSYEHALIEGKRQDKIMEEVMKISDLATKWDSKEVEEKILSLL